MPIIQQTRNGKPVFRLFYAIELVMARPVLVDTDTGEELLDDPIAFTGDPNIYDHIIDPLDGPIIKPFKE